jgi:hypothetical protein
MRTSEYLRFSSYSNPTFAKIRSFTAGEFGLFSFLFAKQQHNNFVMLLLVCIHTEQAEKFA